MEVIEAIISGIEITKDGVRITLKQTDDSWEGDLHNLVLGKCSLFQGRCTFKEAFEEA